MACGTGTTAGIERLYWVSEWLLCPQFLNEQIIVEPISTLTPLVDVVFKNLLYEIFQLQSH